MCNQLTLTASSKTFTWNLDTIREDDWRRLVHELEYVWVRHVKGIPTFQLDEEPLFTVVHNRRAAEEEYPSLFDNDTWDYQQALANRQIGVDYE